MTGCNAIFVWFVVTAADRASDARLVSIRSVHFHCFTLQTVDNSLDEQEIMEQVAVKNKEDNYSNKWTPMYAKVNSSRSDKT